MERNESCIVAGVQAAGVRSSADCRAAENMSATSTRWQDRNRNALAADASYCSETLQ